MFTNSWPECHEFHLVKTLKILSVERSIHVKSVGAQSSPVDEVGYLERELPYQVSSSSLVRGPLLIALVLLYSATLINTHLTQNNTRAIGEDHIFLMYGQVMKMIPELASISKLLDHISVRILSLNKF
ncbi:hypothetical protein TNCV_1201961 [Trichonephila clavipes]|nr:hypothetical protein TNCV_1201961 [Trichonephila clavipes]